MKTGRIEFNKLGCWHTQSRPTFSCDRLRMPQPAGLQKRPCRIFHLRKITRRPLVLIASASLPPR